MVMRTAFASRLIAVGLGITMVAAPATAGVTVNITQVGSDVVANVSGSLDLTGATPACSCGSQPYIWAAEGFLHTGNSSFTGDDYYGVTGTATFGSGGQFDASSTTGDDFGLAAGAGGDANFEVPAGYVSGSALSSSATWTNQTFAALGLTPGTYTYTLPNDSITVNIEGAVPEPATWAMMLVGFGAIGWQMRRRKAALVQFA